MADASAPQLDDLLLPRQLAECILKREGQLLWFGRGGHGCGTLSMMVAVPLMVAAPMALLHTGSEIMGLLLAFAALISLSLGVYYQLSHPYDFVLDLENEKVWSLTSFRPRLKDCFDARDVYIKLFGVWRDDEQMVMAVKLAGPEHPFETRGATSFQGHVFTTHGWQETTQIVQGMLRLAKWKGVVARDVPAAKMAGWNDPPTA